jgi:inosine/xanthosine triphosphate pyrophosphatase family protein
VLPPRGAAGFGWDPVFVPDGHGRGVCGIKRV